MQTRKNEKYSLLMIAPHIDPASNRGGAIHQTELASAIKKKVRLIALFQTGGAIPQPLLTLITFIKVLIHAKEFGLIHDRGYLLGGAGVFAGAITKVPTVLQVDDNWIEGDRASGHWIWRIGLYKKFAIFWIKNFVKRANAVIVVSNSLKKVAVNEWGANPLKVFVVGNGVNLEKFNPRTKPMRNDLGIAKNSKVLTFTGEMAPWHGILEIVKAAEKVLEKRKDCIFLFAGGEKTHEKYVGRVKRYVSARGMDENIRFIGKVPYEKVPALLASSDILLAPYTQPKNVNFGFSPLKLFEYMAMEKPIVTSDLPWIHEIISEKEACLFKNPRDSAEFSKSILGILEDKKYASRIARAARKLAVEKYSWDKIAEKMEAVYRTVLK